MQLDVGNEPTLKFAYVKCITLKCITRVLMKTETYK